MRFLLPGLIFGRAALRFDELATAVEYGLPYFAIGKCDYGFALPCHLYQNGRCLIYSNRPPCLPKISIPSAKAARHRRNLSGKWVAYCGSSEPLEGLNQ